MIPRRPPRWLVGARRLAGRCGVWLMAGGGIVVAIQALWIFYGVVMRYVFRAPDAVVTEATALLLFPVAFLGLAYALKSDAYPRVSAFADRLPARWRRRLDIANAFLIAAVGGFFAIAAIAACRRDFFSGAASEILLWPRWAFWLPAALALALFASYALLRCAEMVCGGRPDEEL